MSAGSVLHLTILALLAVDCAGDDKQANNATSDSANKSTVRSADLTGAGSTFAYPLYSKWISEYGSTAKVRVTYQSVGSGEGVRQLAEQTVDFGATDGPMTDDEIGKAKGGPVLHVPTALGAVAITYNLPGVTPALKLTSDIIADIFRGKLLTWNDKRLVVLNPGMSLPAQDIVLVHRSDGSGTTYVFTDYLTTVNADWRKAVGRGKDVKWPAGLAGKGNDGVTAQVKLLPGSIGYVELGYAKKRQLPVALVKNAAGEFVAPSVESVIAAASGVAEKLPANTDYRISIVNAPGAQSYPICTFTWILAYTTQRDPVKGKRLVDFIKWGLTNGQAFEEALYYAPLPASMTNALLQRIDSIKVGG